MFDNISVFYDHVQDRLISDCICCGKCVSQCKVMDHIPGAVDPAAVQRDILAFLSDRSDLSAGAV